uniref:PIPK domain-containing protein n=1 Tax=Hyaloperonospora arabidopsidis (strain Emoy2) TaxID=559515 RepID=M4BSG3_HYAAE
MTDLYLAWQLTALMAGLVSIGVMIAVFIKYPSSRLHPGIILMTIVMSLTIASIMRVGLHAWHLVLGPDHDDGFLSATLSRVANEELGYDSGRPVEPYVSFFFWSYFFFNTSTTLWFLMLALDLIFSLSNPFLPFNADNVKHHIYAWPASVIYCFIFRYVLKEFQDTVTASVMLYFDVPAHLTLLYISFALIQSWRRSRILETHAHATTRRMAKRILPYLGVFAVYTMVALSISLVQLGTAFGQILPNTLDQLALVLEGLAVFALFCWDAGILRVPMDQREDGVVRDTRNSSSSSRVAMSQGEAGGAGARSSTSRGAMSVPLSNPSEEIDVSNKLRMDVMRYMSLGIMKSIEMAQVAEKDAQELSLSAEHTGSDTEAAGLHAGGCYSNIGFHDYNYVESMGVLVYGMKHSTMLNFRDCAPKVFHRIRAQFNIDQDFYRESFDPSRILSEHGSEGKSGNIFYFTANKQFMVKSVPKEEFDTLRAILPHYHEYLQSNPKSMLCRYYGCHSISLPIGKRRMYFVVMQNLFNEGAVDQRFDLKGNRDRRQAVSATVMEGLIHVAKHRNIISQLLMDVDFLKLSSGMSLSYANTASQQDQLCSDFVFLASRGIIDYSILLGVRYKNDLDPVGVHSNGLLSHDEKEIYYVGIVDMLQRYNWRWTVQRWFLGYLFCKDLHDVSAVPPIEYATRLADFVREKLFDIQDTNTSASSFYKDPRTRLGSDNAGERDRSSCSSSDVPTPPTSQGFRKMQYSDRCSIDMQHLSVFSLGTAEMDPSPPSSSASSSSSSSNSSPSVAYSSVCESPVQGLASAKARSAATFFV